MDTGFKLSAFFERPRADVLKTGALWILLTLLVGTVGAQAKKPISKQGLLEAVRLNGLSTEELVQQVQQRGVSFRLTSEDEGEFRAGGARPELIEAVRTNYRPAGAPPTESSKPGSKGNSVPSGPPLSKDQIVAMLQAGTLPARIEQFVEARGVNFSLNDQITREIRSAGGNRSLLGAISEKAAGGGTASSPTSPANPGANAATDYDDLTDQAQMALNAMNPVQALSLLQQAIKLDPSQSKAHQLFGYAQLYYNRDLAAAEKSMRAAIERGGAAVFKVYHDHGTGAFTSFCEGSFFVSKSRVNFRTTKQGDTFEADDASIKEAKLNKKLLGLSLSARFNAFHIKVTRPDGKSRNYNFAPATGKEDESNLLISLIGSYQ